MRARTTGTTQSEQYGKTVRHWCYIWAVRTWRYIYTGTCMHMYIYTDSMDVYIDYQGHVGGAVFCGGGGIEITGVGRDF